MGGPDFGRPRFRSAPVSVVTEIKTYPVELAAQPHLGLRKIGQLDAKKAAGKLLCDYVSLE